ncbi:hypothetical protein B0O99DRAFT_657001 [Bisporella sp. PMI_857]|nr:hypothetical protein B0O99DRAFT_657001 [Bisporella sp. PMI_857]
MVGAPTLVNMGTHSLRLYSTDLDPTHILKNQPCSSSQALASSGPSWAAVIRLLPPFAHIYSYDRPVYRAPEAPHLPPAAENIAKKLDLLIIKQPLILVAHPMWRNPHLEAISQGLEVYGIHILASDKERAEYRPSFSTIAKKIRKSNPALPGDKSVCVFIEKSGWDYKGLYDTSVERGSGTEEERRAARDLVRTWDKNGEALQKEIFIYSTHSEVVIAAESGHRIELTQPEVSADAADWAAEANIRSGQT